MREKELQEMKAKKKADDRIRYLAQQKRELNLFSMGESPSLKGITPDIMQELSEPEHPDDHHGHQINFEEDDPMRVRGSFYLAKQGFGAI